MTGRQDEMFVSDGRIITRRAQDTITLMHRLLLLLLAASPLAAQKRELPPIPRYEVHRARQPIVIDGKLDDAAWKSAGIIQFRFPWDQQTGAKQKTTARLLWNDELSVRGIRVRGYRHHRPLHGTRRPDI